MKLIWVGSQKQFLPSITSHPQLTIWHILNKVGRCTKLIQPINFISQQLVICPLCQSIKSHIYQRTQELNPFLHIFIFYENFCNCNLGYGVGWLWFICILSRRVHYLRVHAAANILLLYMADRYISFGKVVCT